MSSSPQQLMNFPQSLRARRGWKWGVAESSAASGCMGPAALEILDRLPQTHTAVWFELIEGEPSMGLSDQSTA